MLSIKFLHKFHTQVHGFTVKSLKQMILCLWKIRCPWLVVKMGLGVHVWCGCGWVFVCHCQGWKWKLTFDPMLTSASGSFTSVQWYFTFTYLVPSIQGSPRNSLVAENSHVSLPWQNLSIASVAPSSEQQVSATCASGDAGHLPSVTVTVASMMSMNWDSHLIFICLLPQFPVSFSSLIAAKI